MIQLFSGRSKKLKTATSLFLLIFFVMAMAIIAVPKNILASTYGEGIYGDCSYGQNGCNENGSPVIPSSTPITPETNSNSSSSTDSSKDLVASSPTVVNNNDLTFSIFDSTTNTDTSMSTDSTPTFTTQYPILRGHTVPYATVTIEIDGTPVEVIADANGDWQYKVTHPLAFGEHEIKITIKDKDSNETISENTYKINIAEKTEVANNETKSSKSHKTLTIIGIIALILSAIISIWILIARRRRKKHLNY